MQIDKYYMPRYLDDPYKVAYFTIDEIIALIVPFFTGFFLFDSMIGSLVIGGLLVFIIKKLKGEEGHYFMFHMAWWYFPQFINFRSTPPSHIREILG